MKQSNTNGNTGDIYNINSDNMYSGRWLHFACRVVLLCGLLLAVVSSCKIEEEDSNNPIIKVTPLEPSISVCANIEKTERPKNKTELKALIKEFTDAKDWQAEFKPY